MLERSVPLWIIYGLVAYLVLFTFLVAILHEWKIDRRKDRPPQTFKLLRTPGETLRRRVQKADENLTAYLFGAAFGPLLLSSAVLLLVIRFPKSLLLPGLTAVPLTFAIGVVVGVILLFRFLNRRRNDFIGYLGERSVAEQLQPLLAEGYRVFHDVPAKGRDKDFNVDHVVVGPSGVAAIEVKTRRKKKGRPGFEEHVVTYDGQRLIWPWGEDKCGIEQVQAEADWLQEFLERRTGIKVHPKPILAFPGWLVKERSLGGFRIANHKVVPSIVREWRRETLSSEQIDLISRQLEERCRDVED